MTMKCIICDSDSEYYFSKTYTESPYDEFMKDIGTVDYHKCTNCGFVLSKTHKELDAEKWDRLNVQFHHHLEDPEVNTEINQPPYAEQAMMIAMLGKHGLIDTSSMIDYAAGYGSLSKILAKYFSVSLPISDPYVQADGQSNYVPVDKLASYKTVVNAAMFEHVTNREALEAVNDLVEDDGSLILHTRISGFIPDDPEWFYLRPPVHTAFHTNASMAILMEQWGYKASIYCLPSRCWVLLKKDIPDLEERVKNLNLELQSPWFHCKQGFVDYWKGF